MLSLTLSTNLISVFIHSVSTVQNLRVIFNTDLGQKIGQPLNIQKKEWTNSLN